jgi:drug/metabolite transporter (DMT)-like permease
MNYLLLILSVCLSSTAQIFLKFASLAPIRTNEWFLHIGLSVASYGLAFVVYSFVLRAWPINVASPVTTIALTVIVFSFGVLFLHEQASWKQILGIGFGLLSIIFLLSR